MKERDKNSQDQKNGEEKVYLKKNSVMTVKMIQGASLVTHWPPVRQCRRHMLVPCFRKIPHAMRQIRPCATTIEPML